MTKPNHLAFPYEMQLQSGLNKREYFAAQVVAGLQFDTHGSGGAKEVATVAIEVADALIAALNEPKPASEALRKLRTWLDDVKDQTGTRICLRCDALTVTIADLRALAEERP